MIENEEPRIKPGAIIPGEDLEDLSVDDLRERKEILLNELERAEAMIARKEAGRAAADAVFKQ